MNIERGFKRIGTVLGVFLGLYFWLKVVWWIEDNIYWATKYGTAPNWWPTPDNSLITSFLLAVPAYFVGFYVMRFTAWVISWVLVGFKEEQKASK